MKRKITNEYNSPLMVLQLEVSPSGVVTGCFCTCCPQRGKPAGTGGKCDSSPTRNTRA